ncbi:MAG: ABC transporter permease [Myxococcota bacterium]
MRFVNQTILGFIKKELRQALRDPRMRALLIMMPIMQLVLFGFALSTDVHNIRLSIVGIEGDAVLQQIGEHAYASGWLVPAVVKHTDPMAQIQANEADVVLIPPPEGFTQSVGRGEGQLQLLINASNVIRAQSAENYLREIIRNVTAKEMKIGATPAPINLKMRILYNPSMRTAVFQVPAVMGMLVLMTTLFFTALAVSREKELGTFEMLLSSPATPMEILLGKAIPFVLIGLFNLPLILAVAMFGFNVPMHGSFLVLFLAVLIFVCSSVAMGILISTISKTQQQAMLAGFLCLYPMQMLSGLLFPVENIPAFMKVLTYINPLTYFLELLRNIMLKGGDAQLVIHHLCILSAMAIFLMALSYNRFKTTLG